MIKAQIKQHITGAEQPLAEDTISHDSHQFVPKTPFHPPQHQMHPFKKAPRPPPAAAEVGLNAASTTQTLWPYVLIVDKNNLSVVENYV